jgi:sulfate adenylyltransferase subunit 1
MDWYQGTPLLNTLETMKIRSDINKVDARFPVQSVIRPQSKEFIDYRGYAGKIQSGRLKKHDEVMVLPAGFTSRIKSINQGKDSIEEAFAPMSVAITLEDNIDISRGDMIVPINNIPEKTQEINAMICWLGDEPYQPRTKFLVQHTSNEQTAMVKDIVYKVDIENLNHLEDDKEIKMNDIACIRLKSGGPLMVDDFNSNRQTGSFILVNPNTNETVAAGMVV